MSKKKVVQMEQVVAPKLLIDATNMVALRCNGGHVLLVDKNCAMVSRRCRDYMADKEDLFMVAGPGTSIVEEATGGRSKSMQNAANATGTLASLGETRLRYPDAQQAVPYCVIGSDADADGDGVVWVAQERMLEEFQRRLASMQQQQQHQQLGGTMQHGEKERRAMSSSGRTKQTVSMTPFAHIDDTTPAGESRRLYPLIDLPDVEPELLDLAADFMYYKYRMDCDPEKRVPFNPGESPETIARLVAISTILEM